MLQIIKCSRWVAPQSHRVSHRFKRRSLGPCWRASVPHVTCGMLTMQRVSNFVLHFLSCLESGEKMEAHFIIFTQFVRLHWALQLYVRARLLKTRDLLSNLEFFLLLLSHGKSRLTVFWGGEWWWNLFPRLVCWAKKFRHGCVELRDIANVCSFAPTLKLWRDNGAPSVLSADECSGGAPLSPQPQPGIQLGRPQDVYNRGFRMCSCPGAPGKDWTTQTPFCKGF